MENMKNKKTGKREKKRLIEIGKELERELKVCYELACISCGSCGRC